MRTLVVEESAGARRFLRRFLVEDGHPDVTEARTASDAARLLAADRFDLVLTSDPGVLEIVKSLPALLLLGATSSEVPCAGTHSILRKPLRLRVLRAKMHEVVKRREMLDQSSGDTMTGHIGDLGVPELIQFLTSCRQSGCLVIQAEDGRGVVHVRDGELVAATCDWLAGDAAIFRLATFETGMFRFRHETRNIPGNISMPTMTLMIEAMRRRDELLS